MKGYQKSTDLIVFGTGCVGTEGDDAMLWRKT